LSPPWWPIFISKGSGGREAARGLRREQAQMLWDCINQIKTEKESKGIPFSDVLACGDFNIVSGSDEYFELLEILHHPLDLFVELFCGGDLALATTMSTTIGEHGQRLDYFFSFGEPDLMNFVPTEASLRKKEITGKFLSDHNGVAVKLNKHN